MVGPSATGSENGNPSSTISAPPWMSACTMPSVASDVGSPAHTYAIRALSPRDRSSENLSGIFIFDLLFEFNNGFKVFVTSAR